MPKRYTVGDKHHKLNKYTILDNHAPTKAYASVGAIDNIGDVCEITGGNFYGGVFHGGIFKSGTFHAGEYTGGYFHGGDYFGGEFHSGEFRIAIIYDGVFDGPSFVNTVIYGGWFSGNYQCYTAAIFGNESLISTQPKSQIGGFSTVYGGERGDRLGGILGVSDLES